MAMRNPAATVIEAVRQRMASRLTMAGHHSRDRQPYFREEPIIEKRKVVGMKIANAASVTFGRLARKLKLPGVSFYRLRHTFRTLGKRAKDRDALLLCMGHKANTVEERYDHEEISFSRVRRVAIAV